MAADSAELWSAKGFGVYTGVNAGTVSNSFEPELGLEGGNDGREKERERGGAAVVRDRQRQKQSNARDKTMLDTDASVNTGCASTALHRTPPYSYTALDTASYSSVGITCRC